MLRTVYLRPDRASLAKDVAKKHGLRVLEEGYVGDGESREYKVTLSGNKGSMEKIEEMTSSTWLPPKTRSQRKR
jgi:hypothetical protein